MINVNQVLERQPDRLWVCFLGGASPGARPQAPLEGSTSSALKGLLATLSRSSLRLGSKDIRIDRVLTMSRDVRSSRILFYIDADPLRSSSERSTRQIRLANESATRMVLGPIKQLPLSADDHRDTRS
jgi:hypothetical protein